MRERVEPTIGVNYCHNDAIVKGKFRGLVKVPDKIVAAVLVKRQMCSAAYRNAAAEHNFTRVEIQLGDARVFPWNPILGARTAIVVPPAGQGP